MCRCADGRAAGHVCLGTKKRWWRRDGDEAALEERGLEELSERDDAGADANADDAGSDPDGGEDLGTNGDNAEVPGGEGEKPGGWGGWWPRCPRLRTVWRRNAACFDIDYKGITWW